MPSGLDCLELDCLALPCRTRSASSVAEYIISPPLNIDGSGEVSLSRPQAPGESRLALFDVLALRCLLHNLLSPALFVCH